MESLLQKIYSNDEFIQMIDDLLNNDTVKQMKNFRQHYETSCFDHCLIASYYCYLYGKKFNLDYKSAARGAMLHDLFLYDWRLPKKDRVEKGMHAFTHGLRALNNANKTFELNEIEKDMILHHMWPVTIAFPKYRESYIVTFMDKYSALKESYLYLMSNLRSKKIYKYAYIFLSLIIFRIV